MDNKAERVMTSQKPGFENQPWELRLGTAVFVVRRDFIDLIAPEIRRNPERVTAILSARLRDASWAPSRKGHTVISPDAPSTDRQIDQSRLAGLAQRLLPGLLMRVEEEIGSPRWRELEAVSRQMTSLPAASAHRGTKSFTKRPSTHGGL